jgi:hypothetical protein
LGHDEAGDQKYLVLQSFSRKQIQDRKSVFFHRGQKGVGSPVEELKRSSMPPKELVREEGRDGILIAHE